jgi:hypothetical protein
MARFVELGGIEPSSNELRHGWSEARVLLGVIFRVTDVDRERPQVTGVPRPFAVPSVLLPSCTKDDDVRVPHRCIVQQ